jgi:hypothetical protein
MGHGARFSAEIYTLGPTRGCHLVPTHVRFKRNMRATNGIPLGCSLLLPVDTVNSVRTLKVLGSSR